MNSLTSGSGRPEFSAHCRPTPATLLISLNQALERGARLMEFSSIVWLLSLLFIFVYFIRLNPAWLYGDDLMFMEHIGVGRFFPLDLPPIDVGRFFPLAFQEYNLISLIGNSPAVIYTWEAGKFTAFAIWLYLIIARLVSPRWAPALTGLFYLIGGRTLYDLFAVAMHHEGGILPLLALYVWIYLKPAPSGRQYGLAGLAALLATYMKEPVFGLFAAQAMVDLIFRGFRLSRGERRLACFLIINAAVFLVLYYHFGYQRQTHNYVDLWASASRLDVWRNAVGQSWGLLAIIPLIRLGQLALRLANKKRPFTFSKIDSLTAGALAYALAFVALRLNEDYYFQPSVFLIFICGLGYLKSCYDSFKTSSVRPANPGRPERRIGTAVLAAVIISGLLIFYGLSLNKIIYDLKHSQTNLHRRLSEPSAAFWQAALAQGFNLYIWEPLPPGEGGAAHHSRFQVLGSYYHFYAETPFKGGFPPAPFTPLDDFRIFAADDRGLMMYRGHSDLEPRPWLGDRDYVSFFAYPSETLLKKSLIRPLRPLIKQYLVWPEETGEVEKVWQDLRAISRALAEYKKDHGSYPLSRGLNALYRTNGVRDGNWIPGLAPAYLDRLPRDPRRGRDPAEQYLYISNGNNYKLSGRPRVINTNILLLYEDRLDSTRPGYVAIWTPPAANW